MAAGRLISTAEWIGPKANSNLIPPYSSEDQAAGARATCPSAG